MNNPKFLQQVLGVLLVVVFLAGCAAPAARPTLSPTFPPPPPTFLPPPTVPPPLTPVQPVQPTSQQSLFTFVKSVKATPTGNFKAGSFAKIGYVPGLDRVTITFDTMLTKPEGKCTNGGYAYREYTTDMVETDKEGLINCYGGWIDTGGMFNGNDFYFVSGGQKNGKGGWQLVKYNALTWTVTTSFFFPLADGKDSGDTGKEESGDPMVSLVNGQIDISSAYKKDASAVGPAADTATHHQFFTTDLQFVNKRILSDSPHITMSSMVETGDAIYFVTGTAFIGGDLVVMKYDKNWKYISTKTLKQKAAQSEGLAFDGKRFYVSYIDTPCTDLSSSCVMNVHLAAFDSSWNPLEDIAVTNFTVADNMRAARPSLILRNGRIYVVYDQEDGNKSPEPWDPQTADMQIYVKVYELTQKP